MNSDVMPVGHLTPDQVRTVLTACAAAAPVRNQRPWRLICTPTALELRAELSTTPPTDGSASRSSGWVQSSADADAEPDPRELLLSCGAALLNVRAAIRVLGAHPAVRLLPDDSQPDLLAVVQPQAGFAAAPADIALAEAIARRRASRPPTGGIPAPMLNRLRRAARVEQTWLAILPTERLEDVQLSHLNRDVQGRDGTAVDADSADWPPSAARSNVMVAVVGSFHDSPLAWLQSGQGMQRVLLTAAAAGLTTTLLAHMVRASQTRGLVRRLIGGGVWPQAVVRLESPAQLSASQTASAAASLEAVHGSVPH